MKFSGEWIPVKACLPEKRGTYLVTMLDFRDWVVFVADFDPKAPNLGFYTLDERMITPRTCENVVAWMAFPEAYDGGATNGV